MNVVYEDADVLVVDKPRRASSCTPAPVRSEGTLVNGLLARHPALAHGGGGAPPRHRASARPGHLRPAGGGADPDGVHGARRRARGAPGRAALHGPRVGRPGGAARRDRRPDRALAPPADATGRGGRRPTGPDPLRGARRATTGRRTWPFWAASWRPAAPTRSACTWPRSAIPSSGTGTTAACGTAIAVPRMFLHAEHLAFDHPVTGQALAFDAPLPPDLAGVLAGLGDPAS